MFQTDSEFEDEVRRIARLLWPAAEFGGAEMEDDRERDGIFETPESVHCVECTVSRAKVKAEEDGAKLDKWVRKRAASDSMRFARGWFVTLHEATAEQRAALKKYQGRVVACSYDQFRSKLVDAKSYLQLRKKYPFGSIRDPKTGLAGFDLQYVPLDISDASGTIVTAGELSGGLEDGGRFVLTGDYGAGKSATAREVFLKLAVRYWKNQTCVFPVLLNLRDHHGQTDPVEALERHGRNVAFGTPSSLVQAWRAGFCVLILDGFDEIASAGWASSVKRLRDLRYRSMELVRRFVRDTPRVAGLLITGRGHFFDSEKELTGALGVTDQFRRLMLSELSVPQVKKLLAEWGWKGGVPEWLPTRPLLLSYLAAHGLLSSENLGDMSTGPAEGWNDLLERISAREAEIEAGIDADSVRRLIEGLASIARATADGLGPISAEAIVDCFKDVCGFTPDDRAAVLLQRLPGLGAASAEDGARVFVDRDFVEAAKAGDVCRFVQDPFGSGLQSDRWLSTMGALGADVAALRCTREGFDAGKLSAALEAATRRGAYTLAADVSMVICSTGVGYKGAKAFLKEVVCEEMALADTEDLSELEFQDCFVVEMELSPEVSERYLPVFRRCHIGRLYGRAGKPDLTPTRFIECEVDEFEHGSGTTHALMALPIPVAARVMLTVLKKLYVQSGRGRKESALFRGLDTQAKAIVQKVMQVLKREEFAVRTREGTVTIWLPMREAAIRRRALAILAAPTSSKDPLMEAARELA